ncbi:unnamed protein product [Adineta steineri]|uniref:Uncharacterized protein n=1 Tax=Adineta steineri TaxID=433720 RepID=A0A815PQ25_9BILA|nr:unnamed protein product [Adineta steineri]
MPMQKNDSYSTQISENIFRLTNVSPIPFNLLEVFADFHQPALIRFFDEHKALGLDIAPFLFGFLVHTAVMLDGAELYNPDGSGYLTSMNLFAQLIGEPGTNKSSLLRAFSSTMSVLSHLFPEFFSETVTETINGKETTNDVSLIENVFIFSDELDVMNIRFGVYLGGSMDNDIKTIGAKLLCQGYDTIRNLLRTTGSTSFFIKRGSINIFGASTGNMLSTVHRQYQNPSMSDGAVSRFLYITASAHKPVSGPPSKILSIQPNMVHILIVMRLIGEYKPILVFGQYKNESEVPTTVSIPDDIQELIQDNGGSILPVEILAELKPTILIPHEDGDREVDGNLLSPQTALKRIMDYYYSESLKTDQKGKSSYTPLQRAFYRKSGAKLAKISALCYIISFAINICYESINFIRFGDGLFMKDVIDNEQYNRLFLFYDHAKNIIKQKMDQAPSYGANNRPLIVVNKAAVKAAEVLYEYSSRTTALLFDDIEAIKIENDSTNISNNLSTKKSFFEEETILLIMASPILSKAWFSNVLTGLPYTGIFKNYLKSKTKIIRLTDAINYLINTGLVQNGIGDKRHLVGARKETLRKTPPCIIRTDKDKLAALESININIDEYEHIYMNSPLPTNMLLTDETIKLILSDNAYIPVLHLFNDICIEQEMERRIAAHVVQHEFFKGKKQYCIISSSQRVNNDGTDIQNNFEFHLDLLSNNNNNLSTSDVSILPINNLASSTSSSPSHIGNSSLFSSLCTSNSTTSLSNSILPNQNNQDNMSLEQELHQIQANILQDYFYSRTLNEKNVVSNMCNENILGTQVLDPVNTSVIKNNELRVPTSNTVHVEKQTKIQDKNQSELNSGNNLMEVINTNSTQSFEPIPDVVQNNNYSFKRLLYEESESPRKKLQKNNINKNEDGKRTTSPIEHTFSTIQPFSSSPVNTNSTITIVKEYWQSGHY